jgi:hypothetical protein
LRGSDECAACPTEMSVVVGEKMSFSALAGRASAIADSAIRDTETEQSILRIAFSADRVEKAVRPR